MAMSLRLSKSKAINPSTKKMGYRTTVKSNGKADMDSLVVSASKNTTMHKAELRMAFELILDSIKESLSAGHIVELKGIGNIGFSCSGAWTETAEEQTKVEHKIGVSFFPSPEIHSAVASARTTWTKDGEGNEPSAPGTGGDGTDPNPDGGAGGEQKPGGSIEG